MSRIFSFSIAFVFDIFLVPYMPLRVEPFNYSLSRGSVKKMVPKSIVRVSVLFSLSALVANKVVPFVFGCFLNLYGA